MGGQRGGAEFGWGGWGGAEFGWGGGWGRGGAEFGWGGLYLDGGGEGWRKVAVSQGRPQNCFPPPAPPQPSPSAAWASSARRRWPRCCSNSSAPGEYYGLRFWRGFRLFPPPPSPLTPDPQVHLPAQHPRQRGEGLGLPGDLRHDRRQPRRRRAGFEGGGRHYFTSIPPPPSLFLPPPSIIII